MEEQADDPISQLASRQRPLFGAYSMTLSAE
jgi:hypothetical protein